MFYFEQPCHTRPVLQCKLWSRGQERPASIPGHHPPIIRLAAIHRVPPFCLEREQGTTTLAPSRLTPTRVEFLRRRYYRGHPGARGEEGPEFFPAKIKIFLRFVTPSGPNRGGEDKKPPKPRKTAPTAQNYDPFFDPETEPEALGDIALDGFDLGAALGIDPEPEASAPGPEVQGGIKVSHRMGARQIYRKAASEAALEKTINWHFREGDCYHCFSFGDVDSFSFSRWYSDSSPSPTPPSAHGVWRARM